MKMEHIADLQTLSFIIKVEAITWAILSVLWLLVILYYFYILYLNWKWKE